MRGPSLESTIDAEKAVDFIKEECWFSNNILVQLQMHSPGVKNVEPTLELLSLTTPSQLSSGQTATFHRSAHPVCCSAFLKLGGPESTRRIEWSSRHRPVNWVPQQYQQFDVRDVFFHPRRQLPVFLISDNLGHLLTRTAWRR